MWIAERMLHLMDPSSGTRTPVTIRIAAPVPMPGSEAFGCTVEMEGLIDDILPIQGIDSFQAVELACRFVHTYLSGCKHAAHLQWPTGEPYEGLPSG